MDESRDDLTEPEFSALRKLAQKNFPKFAIALQHVSTEVQLKVLEQLPEFTKLAKGSLDSVEAAFRAALKSNEDSAARLDQAYAEWRDALLAILDDPDSSLDDELRVTSEIGKVVDAQSRKDSENKAFVLALFTRVAVGALATVGVIALTAVGGRMIMETDSSGNAV